MIDPNDIVIIQCNENFNEKLKLGIKKAWQRRYYYINPREIHKNKWGIFITPNIACLFSKQSLLALFFIIKQGRNKVIVQIGKYIGSWKIAVDFH